METLSAGRLVASLLVAALLATSAPAFAQSSAGAPAAPSDAAVAEARAHYQRGIELTTAGALEAALVEFDRAYAIAASYRILYNVALIRRRLNDFAGSYDAFERYLAEGKDEVPAPRRAEVAEALRELQSYVATLTVDASVEGADLTVDDVPMGTLPLVKPLRVNPGLRRLTAAKAGYVSFTHPVVVAGGDTLAVHLELAPVVVAPPAPIASPPPPSVVTPRSPEHAPSAKRRPLWIGWLASGVLGAGAMTTGLVALSSASSLRTERESPSASRAALDSDRAQTTRWALVSDLLTAGSVVAAAATLYFSVTRDAPARVEVGLSPGAITAKGSF